MFTVLLAVISLLSFTLTRVILLFMMGPVAVPLALWPVAMGRGLIFDVATLAYLLPPVLVLEVVLPARIWQSAWSSRVQRVLLSGALFFLLMLSASEVIFWIEFHTRFNFIALDYLIYTNEVLRNIWQSYPVVWICCTMAVLSWALATVLYRWIEKGDGFRYRIRWGVAAGAVLGLLLSMRLVRVEMMYHQGNAFAEEISGNGLFTLAAAARHNELDYDQFYATLPQDQADQILKDLDVEWTGDVKRRERDIWGDDAEHEPFPPYLKRRPRNLILISVESLSARFVGAYGSTDGLTPFLDRLAQQGLLFRHVYATGTRTVRGLEALSLAVPPIPGQSIIRRPHNARLASMGEMLRFQGFNVFFFYGGYGYFDNMNAFFSANAYTVVDRRSIPSQQVTFENAWGVADEVLFDHALDRLDMAAADQKPFFAHVMTTSNHRPYTYPDGRIDIPSPGGRHGAVKYTDYAIGRLIDRARAKPWFKDTLFVIVADHCASVAGKTELPVADYRIPLILYGPDLIKPGQQDRMISQMDIPPTLFDLLGVAGDDNFFGREVMDQTGPPRAFISNYQNLGYYKNDQLIVLKPKRKIEGYRVDPRTFESTPMTPDPILVNEAIAYYQTASNAYKLGKLELLWKGSPPATRPSATRGAATGTPGAGTAAPPTTASATPAAVPAGHPTATGSILGAAQGSSKGR